MKLRTKIFLLFCLILIGLVNLINISNSRQLTNDEIKELQSVFFDQVDYAKISLATANLPPTLAAIVFGNFILYREESHIGDFSKDYLKMGRLIHEVGHVWANQTRGIQTSLAAILERIKYKDRVYAHEVLTGEKPLADFRYEQQCRILSDYYTNRHLGFDVSKYEATIYKTIMIK